MGGFHFHFVCVLALSMAKMVLPVGKTPTFSRHSPRQMILSKNSFVQNSFTLSSYLVLRIQKAEMPNLGNGMNWTVKQ